MVIQVLVDSGPNFVVLAVPRRKDSYVRKAVPAETMSNTAATVALTTRKRSVLL